MNVIYCTLHVCERINQVNIRLKSMNLHWDVKWLGCKPEDDTVNFLSSQWFTCQSSLAYTHLLQEFGSHLDLELLQRKIYNITLTLTPGLTMWCWWIWRWWTAWSPVQDWIWKLLSKYCKLSIVTTFTWATASYNLDWVNIASCCHSMHLLPGTGPGAGETGGADEPGFGCDAVKISIRPMIHTNHCFHAHLVDLHWCQCLQRKISRLVLWLSQ